MGRPSQLRGAINTYLPNIVFCFFLLGTFFDMDLCWPFLIDSPWFSLSVTVFFSLKPVLWGGA